MLWLHRAWLGFLGVVCVLPPPTLASEKFRYASQIGIAESRPDGTFCLTIEDASLKEGERVLIVVPEVPQRHLTGAVAEKLGSSCTRNTEISKADAFYTVKISSPEPLPDSLSIAVVGFSGRVLQRGGQVRASLDSNGTLDSFRSCASTEGVHLTVWNGKPLSGKRRWHRYYYLGYDVEPTCKAGDS